MAVVGTSLSHTGESSPVEQPPSTKTLTSFKPICFEGEEHSNYYIALIREISKDILRACIISLDDPTQIWISGSLVYV